MWRKPGRSLVRAAIQWQEVGVPFKPAISFGQAKRSMAFT